MNIINVTASASYDVIIGKGIMHEIGKYCKEIGSPNKVVIISDTNVWGLYGATTVKNLETAGLSVYNFVFEAGEESKNANTYLSILNYLAQKQITRSDMLIALGGGVVGDITGFAAATYLRGIAYIQVPTTLLAMVESSVGGKTAIDLPAGKNLVGAFYQPRLVLCDTEALNTLPDNIFRDGCAEVIKYGVLYDEKLFSHLSAQGICFDRESVISRCVELKRNVVSEDEFDNGARQMLNLGHTIGHSIEKESNFTISHGQAVAIGMAIVSKAGAAYGICKPETHSDIVSILGTFGLPVTTNYTCQTLYVNALSDKKRSGGVVNLIIPQKIGTCVIKPTPVEELETFIEAGL